MVEISSFFFVYAGREKDSMTVAYASTIYVGSAHMKNSRKPKMILVAVRESMMRGV